MRIVDLTHTFANTMPVYPGDPEPSLRQFAAVEKEGYCDHTLTTGMHVGTHIDAPMHMIVGGKKMSEIPVEKFSGRGVLIDARGEKELDIDLLHTRFNLRQEAKVEPFGDIVLFYTGWGEKFKEENYFTDFPIMTEALAQELVKRNIKMVGMDTASPDKAPYAVHKILLGAEILIIENLTNLESLVGKTFDVQAFPLKLAADAAPARVVATLN
ncbi:MAG: cyclase family protein [bacterium]|nr:cyclase family protein [bacterium]